MTYVHEYNVNADNVKVEYCFSVVSNAIKVVEMWVNGKYHRTSWMSHEGREKLMVRLEKDLENRLCGTTQDDSSPESFGLETFDDDSVIEPFMTTIGEA